MNYKEEAKATRRQKLMRYAEGGAVSSNKSTRQWQEKSFGEGSRPLDFYRDGVFPPQVLEKSQGRQPSRKNGDAIDYHTDSIAPDVKQIPYSKMWDT